MAKTILTIVMRITVLCTALVAAVVMGTSNATVDLVTFTYQAKYSDWGVFRYFVVVNCVATIYNFLVLLLPSGSQLWCVVVVLDMIMVMIVGSGYLTAGELFHIMQKGDWRAGWTPICGVIPIFCNHVMGAIVVGAGGALIQFILTLYTCHVIFNPLLLPRIN